MLYISILTFQFRFTAFKKIHDSNLEFLHFWGQVVPVHLGVGCGKMTGVGWRGALIHAFLKELVCRCAEWGTVCQGWGAVILWKM